MAPVTNKTATKRSRTPVEASAAVAAGGHRLRAMREAQKLTQLDIAKKTNRQITNQQVNRIELGKIDKPAMYDLVLYGQVFGLTPNEVAALYGYWDGTDDTRKAEDHPYVIQLRHLLQVLPERERDRLVHDLEYDLGRAMRNIAP